MSTGLEEVVAQQRITNRLLVMFMQRLWPDSMPNKHEVSRILIATGATSEEVASIIGTTKGTVEVFKSRDAAREREVLRDREEGQSADGVGPAGHDEPVRGVEQGE